MQSHRVFVSGIAAALILAGCGRQPQPRPPEPVTLATAPYKAGSLSIQCGTLIDGTSDAPRSEVTVVIREGKIAAVNAGYDKPADLASLDLRDYTCLPGLIDMHDHITETFSDSTDMSIYLRRNDDEQWVLSRSQAEATLLAGFTTVRNVGVYHAWQDRELRDAIDRGNVAGPRMQVSGYYLTIANGGGDLIVPSMPREEIPPEFHAGVAKGAEEFRRKAQIAIDGGADVLKVIASGAVLAYGGVPGEREMTEDEIRAVVEVAHAAGKKVAAHAHGAESIKDAIRAGADTIEHASLIDDAGIALAKERGVALSMDVYNGDYIDTEGRKQGWPEEFLRKNSETTEAQRQAFTKAHAAGVAIVYGTDAGVYPHGWNARQFPIMVQRGMTPMEAIQSATSVAAKYMGWEDRVGAIAPGKFGDLIAVKGDPLQDITVLQSPIVVIKDGLAFRLPAVQ
ncbi:MAG TPA: amidohydrolase family protein [Povalibacter sp.]|uniref:metal-dependent hydrolase family protein n=1 Tax=Povalibacter sp. TaxID=1962978 RepID=UPI002C1CC39A|nr:amidohydrolase family protein [Povalibacter sp.]HMN44152.1 amidohydrolase family protein [Povalibacter sp.]